MRRLVLLAGGVLLASGAFSAFQVHRFVSGARLADGMVTRLNAGGSHPQIAFHAAGGAAVSFPQGGMIMGFRDGQLLPVLYDPADPPGSARVKSFGSLWGGSLVLAVIGAVLLGLAILSRRRPIGFYHRGR